MLVAGGLGGGCYQVYVSCSLSRLPAGAALNMIFPWGWAPSLPDILVLISQILHFPFHLVSYILSCSTFVYLISLTLLSLSFLSLTPLNLLSLP